MEVCGLRGPYSAPQVSFLWVLGVGVNDAASPQLGVPVFCLSGQPLLPELDICCHQNPPRYPPEPLVARPAGAVAGTQRCPRPSMDGCSQLRLLHEAPEPLPDFRDAVVSPLGPPRILPESSQSLPQVLPVSLGSPGLLPECSLGLPGTGLQCSPHPTFSGLSHYAWLGTS